MAIFTVGIELGPLAVLRDATSVFNFLTQLQDASYLMQFISQNRVNIYIMCGPGSVVGIATAYGLDGPGIESRWGEIFHASPDRP